jgi:hypothetical protein
MMFMRPRALLAAIAVAGAVAAVVACGPSFQAVYEGDVQFEHCYALDESAGSTLDEKANCWRDWTKNYTYGQTRDRVEYAASRHYALTVAPSLPTDDLLQQAAPGGGFRKRLIAAPAPTTMFAPPPNTMPDSPDAGAAAQGEGTGSTGAAAPRPPGTACAEDCNGEWKSCRDACAGKACATCDVSHSACMVACFSDAGS